MKFKSLMPNMFYADISMGLRLFVDCLGFKVDYNDLKSVSPSCIVTKDSLRVFLKQDEELALQDRPEIRLETDDIQEVFAEVYGRCPALLHPNGNTVTQKPWGVKEFALLDESGVCVIIYQG